MTKITKNKVQNLINQNLPLITKNQTNKIRLKCHWQHRPSGKWVIKWLSSVFFFSLPYTLTQAQTHSLSGHYKPLPDVISLPVLSFFLINQGCSRIPRVHAHSENSNPQHVVHPNMMSPDVYHIDSRIINKAFIQHCRYTSPKVHTEFEGSNSRPDALVEP